MKRGIMLILLIIVFIIVFLYLDNNYIVIRKIDINSKRVPIEFNGFKIVHISDLHSKSFGKNQKILIGKVKKQNPDIIVLTGDMVERRHYDEKPVVELCNELVKIAPTYYVTGNHEIWSGKFNSLEKKLKSIGVIVLRNEVKDLKIGKSKISIIGLDYPHSNKGETKEVTDNLMALDNLTQRNNFRILLSHRPDLIGLYSAFHFDLVFSGHAHGGQVRLPFVGGLIAPHQGFFPKYTSGLYNNKDTSMIVSRGLGNSLFPFRIFNFPEIITVTLYTQ
ncbi:MAG: metallophosphoesterase [Clostridiales bacterium]|nr:metallophosphoesterase [Clostridiales bacterium]